MSELRRVIDKYRFKRFDQLAPDEQDEYFGAIAQRGASEALKSLGLDDPDAMLDIRDVRDLLKGYRVVKKTVWSQALKVAVAAATMWLVLKFFPVGKAKEIMMLIGSS